MWPKSYKNYPKDEDLIRYQVQPGKGIKGCEMHEFNGWGESYHIKKSRGIIATILKKLKKRS